MEENRFKLQMKGNRSKLRMEGTGLSSKWRGTGLSGEQVQLTMEETGPARNEMDSLTLHRVVVSDLYRGYKDTKRLTLGSYIISSFTLLLVKYLLKVRNI